MDLFDGKTAIITGGASGIGRAVGELLARRGANLILADVNGDLAGQTAGRIVDGGGKAKAVKLDVTDFDAVEKLVDEVVSEHGHLDYMFNNAGVVVFSRTHEHPIEEWRRVIDINLYGVVNGVAAAYPVMVKQGSGHIVNTGSVAGLIPSPMEISYTTSKYGVVGLSHALREEAKEHGVKVTVVCPGFIRTPIYENAKVINMDRDKATGALPKPGDVDKAADVIIKGVKRNKATIVITPLAVFLGKLQRISPDFARWVIYFDLRRRLKEVLNDQKMKLNRRTFIQTAGAAAAGMAAGTGLARSAKASEKPNLLLIIVDQWRQRRWFPDDARTPGVDRLRSEGLSFSNHFTCAVPCSPSRASLFTGLHLPQHDIQGNIDPLGGNVHSLDPSITTLGHLFKQAGYRTPYFGKWHLTHMKDYLRGGLSAYGFEEWRGPDRDGLPLEGLSRDGQFAHQAIRWLEKNGSQGPWFLTCSLINPHDICFYRRLDVPPALVPDVCEKLPDNFNDSLAGKPRIQKQYQEGYGSFMKTTPDQPEKVWREYIDFYCYLTRKVDEQIGRVLDALEQFGLSENTIVIFTADHGEMCGSHRLQAKGPFIYQENNNVPLVLRWPGRVRAGSETGALTQSVDIFHTLIELAAVSAVVDHLPGRSLAALVADPGKQVNQHALMSFNYDLESPFAGFIVGGQDVSQRAPMQVRAIHDGRYKFARYFDPGMEEEQEMYDLVNDPLEMRNLAGDPGYRALHKEMAEKLQEAETKEMAPQPGQKYRS